MFEGRNLAVNYYNRLVFSVIALYISKKKKDGSTITINIFLSI